MILRPPRSTRTDTLFPYTTLVRSDQHEQDNHRHLRLALCAMARRVLSEGADPGSGTCIRITPVRRHRTQRLVLFAAAARVLRALVRADATRFRDRKSTRLNSSH